MTATDLSRLADLVEEDSLPGWLRKEIELRKPDILKALEEEGSVTLHGPKGEEVTIHAKGKLKTAAA